MNVYLETFARDFLKNGLAECTDSERHLFKRMYSPDDLEKPIDQVVDDMDPKKLDWAMIQLENTLKKKLKKG